MTERGAELIDRLASVRRATRRAAATGAGLTAAQLDALTYLASCNRFSDTPAAVAEYLATTRGTASQSLLALERKGLLHREPDPLDGRVHHLRPTEAGLDLVGASARADAVADALAALGPDAERLEILLERCLRTAQLRRGGRTFGTCRECRHLGGRPSDRRCGLTGLGLTEADTGLLCIEHEPVRPA
ncbi:MAG: MarR family winged helix-turn-helix transcriptional regulator [Miltoncostaeaceae bacterium]